MPDDTSIRCPACGKVNRTQDEDQDTNRTTDCARCQADLLPIHRIQRSSAQLQNKLLHQLATGQKADAQATLRKWQTLSPEIPAALSHWLGK